MEPAKEAWELLESLSCLEVAVASAVATPQTVDESPPLTPTQRESTQDVAPKTPDVAPKTPEPAPKCPDEAPVKGEQAEQVQGQPSAGEKAEGEMEATKEQQKKPMTRKAPHVNHDVRYPFQFLLALQEKLILCAKSRLNRMVKKHKKRKDLEAPSWLAAEWANGNKRAIAEKYSEFNFDKELIYNNK